MTRTQVYLVGIGFVSEQLHLLLFFERERDIIACFFKFRHLIFNDHVCKTHKRSVYISEGKRHLFSSLLHTVSTLFPALLSPALRYILITICYSAVQTLNTDVSCSTREFPESALFVIICKNHERERQGEKDTVEKISHKTQQNTIWPYITIYRTTVRVLDEYKTFEIEAPQHAFVLICLC